RRLPPCELGKGGCHGGVVGRRPDLRWARLVPAEQRHAGRRAHGTASTASACSVAPLLALLGPACSAASAVVRLLPGSGAGLGGVVAEEERVVVGNGMRGIVRRQGGVGAARSGETPSR